MNCDATVDDSNVGKISFDEDGGHVENKVISFIYGRIMARSLQYDYRLYMYTH